MRGSTIVARAGNQRESSGDPTAHAEIVALRAAAESVTGWRLDDMTIYVTLEPCPMCAGALLAARVGRLVYGAPDLKAGACGSLYNLCVDPRLNHELEVTPGVLAVESPRCSPHGSLIGARAEAASGPRMRSPPDQRREWDLNPRWAGPTTVFETVRFGRSRIPPTAAASL